jgi:formylglycine-generating enzyme
MVTRRDTAAQPNLARIPAGNFLMGAADLEADQRPVHRVYVSEFFIGRFPVTQDEYAQFVNLTGYPAPALDRLPLVAVDDGHESEFRRLAAAYTWEDDIPPAGHGSHPVVLVRYEDALAYCRWCSDLLQREVRLPTEAEWEKAARGGVDGCRYPWGDEPPDSLLCHFLADQSVKSERGTRPTGTCPPNGYGLYDVAGNVWEWVADWYSPSYYGASEVRDPPGPDRGAMRIIRGGAWVTEDVRMLRCAWRHVVPPDTYAYSMGFRIVCAA